jgi:hypothetical protein
LCTLATNTISPQPLRSLTIVFLLFIPVIFKSSWTSYLHLLCAFHSFLTPSIVAAPICFGILRFFILSTWPYPLSRRDFYKFYSTCP